MNTKTIPMFMAVSLIVKSKNNPNPPTKVAQPYNECYSTVHSVKYWYLHTRRMNLTNMLLFTKAKIWN